MSIRRWLLATVAAVAGLLIIGRLLADVYADYAWYRAVSAGAVWSAHATTITVVRVGAWIVASAFAFANFLGVRHSIVRLVLQHRISNLDIGETVPARHLTTAAIALSVVVGGALALAPIEWTEFALAWHGVPFMEADSFFQIDLSFFLYQLPAEFTAWSWALLIVTTVTMVVILLYIAADGLRIDKNRLYASVHVRRHLMALAGVLLLLVAWYFRIEQYRLLLIPATADASAPLLTHRVAVPSAFYLGVGMLGLGLFVIGAGFARQFRLGLSALAVAFALWVMARQLVPVVAERMADKQKVSEENARQFVTEAAVSRRAFGAAGLGAPDDRVRYPSLAAAAPSVQFWDPPALRRAIAPTHVPDSANSWIGWRGTPTGLVSDVVVRGEDRGDARMSWLVARVDAALADIDGSPLDVPEPGRESWGGGARRGIPPPLVFPGATGYEVVLDSLHRKTGVLLDRMGLRLALAWSLQNPSLAFGARTAGQTTVVSHRDVRERLRRVAPFFVQGSAVTPVVVGDSVYWVVDLYSASAWYPGSQPVTVGRQTWRYFRHAAVGVLEAETGDVSLVADSAPDPIARTWIKRFPGLFTTWSSLPAAIEEALPPATDAVHVAARTLSQFGVGGETGGTRRLAPNGADALAAAPAPVFAMRGGGATVLLTPLIDLRDRIRGVLVATGGRDRRLAWMAQPDSSLRWPSVLERLRTLDSTSGRREPMLVRGGVRAVPTVTGLAFAQPIYRWPEQGAPSLEYVAMLEGDVAQRVVSIQGGGGEGARIGAMSPAASAEELRSRVAALHGAMRAALERGDWSAYGRAFDALGRLVGRQQKP
jgi:uncharacterized membrane protein (UPF0182 family)